MEDPNADACLPPGWTVKVKVRENGKKDKYYSPPSSDKKFNSIVGVYRYLDNAQNKANIPSRASKRLAGIKADPVQELQTRRVRRDVVKQPGEDETVINADRSADSLSNDEMKQFNAIDESETKFNDKSAENSMENNANVKECAEVLENDAKLECAGDFPLKEILTDPCIAFAIQTLTGETFETSKDSQISSELKSETSNGKKINIVHDDSNVRNVLSSPKNFAISQEHVSVVQIEKANKNAGSCSEKKVDNFSKMDPKNCIQHVKTERMLVRESSVLN